jgi:hypothetical protein
MKHFACICLAVCGLASAAPLRAEPEQQRPLLEAPRHDQGYYYALGVHGGMANVRDDGAFIDPLGGFSAALHLGQSVNTWTDLGLALELGFVPAGERTGSMYSFGIDWTLRPLGDAFARLSTAIGVSRVSAAADSDDTASAFGSVLGVTLGYAWFPWAAPRQSGGFAVTPVLRISTVQPFTDDAAFWTMVGFEITRWTGLPREQLDLSLDEAFPGKAR